MTIAKVAKAAGVSPATVSRVINKNPSVSFGTVHLVREAMAQVGYKPSRAENRPGRPRQRASLERLSAKMDAFALLTTGAGWSPVVRGFEASINALHCTTIICDTNGVVDTQGNQLMRVMDQRVAGVALVPVYAPPTPAYHVNQLQRAGIPVVLVHRNVPEAKAPCIELPAEQIGRMAAEYIVKCGHHRVAYFTGSRYPITESYEIGLRNELRSHGADLPKDMVICGSAEEAFAEQEMERDLSKRLEQMLVAPDRPTALFCSFDDFAERAYLIAAHLGLHVPKDLLIVSVRDKDFSRPVQRRISAITIDGKGTGALAVRLLVEMQQGKRQINDCERFRVPIALYEGHADQD